MNTAVRTEKKEKGMTVFEYAVISSIISSAALGAIVALGIKFMTLFAS